jgi:hypothetical protein
MTAVQSIHGLPNHWFGYQLYIRGNFQRTADNQVQCIATATDLKPRTRYPVITSIMFLKWLQPPGVQDFSRSFNRSVHNFLFQSTYLDSSALRQRDP